MTPELSGDLSGGPYPSLTNIDGAYLFNHHFTAYMEVNNKRPHWLVSYFHFN
jgi:hypothetical protein